MTPKEKAFELVERYDFISTHDGLDIMDEELTMLDRKQCALIAVDEILNLGLHDVGDYRNDQSTMEDFSTATWYINYWEEVKQEIEKL